ncbi:alpha-glucosidase [Niabella hirudinis]
MHFFRSLVFIVMAMIQAMAAQAAGRVYTATSPDGYYVFQCYQKPATDTTSALYYTLSYKNVKIIDESLMELRLDNHLSEQAMALKVDRRTRWFDKLQITGVDSVRVNSGWTPVYGEQSRIRDHYRALTVHLVKEDNPIYKMDLQVRVYNEGAAFRFFFPENEKGTYYRVIAENTEFALPAGTRAWHHSWAQAPYKLMSLSGWPGESERPLTLELPNGWYACLAEAQMVDYARTKFKLSLSKPNTIVTSMYTPADLISPFATPWRVIMIAAEAGQLIQNNALLLNLNEPSKINNPDWIKPGKIMRVMTQTTKDALENIDFAARQGLQYILFDWKWYGPAFSFSSDATKVAIPDFDLPAIIRYGKEKGIGVWLYVNQQALLAQSDSLFKVYHNWGVRGVKFGFVQVGSHRWTTWIEDMFRKAAENQVMLNVHDDWRPTGEQRTWPNLMTAEGIRGNEEMPDATHNTILPFTRFMAGAADYTICYYDKRIRTTHAHQLALAAIYYSPIQTLFWYDKPGMSNNEPELEFWKAIPTTWDETYVIQGRPGAFITTARRSGSSWFIGAITNNEARQLRINFSFLPKNKRYQAVIYSDDDTAPTKTKVGIRKTVITSKTVLDARLKPSGGQAIWLTQQ